MDERQPLLESQPTNETNIQSNGKHNIVEFDPAGDPDNPMDWPTKFRWSIVLLLAFMAFTVTFTCTGIVPVASRIVLDLEGHKNKSASVLFVTIWELGEAAGPLFIAPLSEVFGRRPIYNIANVLFVVSIIITALSEGTGPLIFSRFLSGCAVASNVLNPSIIGDIFPPESRGSAMSAVFLAPLIGGAFSPAIAGAIAESLGWREIMWTCAILAAVCEVVFLILFRETYKVTILRRRAARLRKETGDKSIRTQFDKEDSSQAMAFLKTMFRPVVVLSGSFILQGLSLWGGLVFTFFYIMATMLPDMLEEIYHFSPSQTGLSVLSFSIGSIIGIATCNLLVDRIFVRLEKKNSLKYKTYPEGRLPLPVAGAFVLPIFVAFWGVSAELRWPVIILLLSIVLMGNCLLICVVPMMTYVTDAFGLFSASALTAVLIVRCLMGTFLPLLTGPLTQKFGYGYGFLILAGCALLLAPIPMLVLRYGTRWRQHSPYTKDE